MPFTNVHPTGIGFPSPNAFDASHLPTLREYTAISHEQGAKIVAQIAHAGSRENRFRFPLAVIDTIDEMRRRKNCPDFIIGYRFSPEEPGADGLTMYGFHYQAKFSRKVCLQRKRRDTRHRPHHRTAVER